MERSAESHRLAQTDESYVATPMACTRIVSHIECNFGIRNPGAGIILYAMIRRAEELVPELNI